ncbi:long-chain fatty acid--CoA ligase [Pullulanibacillus sp. KACC 23026]|uniref:long-chain fatty acid--CoA ligase n=1 Tax=Pullulanibacillus sp. KACC 23026 TaxID=3028315 RepID=UPI0023B14A4B|nr:long-chain fatty acid--CoA ligase [Pullulanibacillus sp. KACC 23026]WEG14974.1 long-chain fatty acid--CoA ligase [Pullulanibacillus sp. KACC 23026]
MMSFPLTLTHFLDRAERYYAKTEIVSRLPDRSIHRYTYAAFAKRAKQLAESLLRAGLNPGDRVATLMWNHYAHAEAYFGIPATGGVLHTLNLRLPPNDIAYIINHAEDRFLIIDDVLLPLLEQFRDQVSFERIFVVPLTGQPVNPTRYESYEDFLATATGRFLAPSIDENEAAAMCYTSGTTGRPKGVVYSHRALVLHTLMEVTPDALNLSNQDAILPLVPMFHVNGWGFPYAGAMVGAKQVYPGPHLDPESLLELIDREGVTVTGGVPTIWLGVAEALECFPKRWNIKGTRVVSGGAAIPEGTIRKLEANGCHVLHAWGMTETTPLASTNFLKKTMNDLTEDEKIKLKTKQGIAVPFVEARIMREEGEAAWDGKAMGELEVRGPWITSSYYRQPETASSFSKDGWLRTGDIATIDEEGYIKITDRTKDLIKSGGEWISSVDLENAIMGHPAVAEAAVIAIPHPKWQERPLAAVVLKPGQTVSPEDLLAFLAPQFPKWYLPDTIVFIDEIPRTSTGKFMKAKLREQFIG